MQSGVERDYIFANKTDRDRFSALIHSVEEGALPPGSVPIDVVTPRATGKPMRLFVTTWNMGDAKPSKNLKEWLPTNGSVDLFVVGTQESKLGSGVLA